MKLKNVNPHNVQHVIPTWIESPFRVAKWIDAALEELYASQPGLRPARWDMVARFWLEIDLDYDRPGVRVCCPDGGEEDGLRVGMLAIKARGSTVVVPVNSIFKGSVPLRGTHCVYLHTIMTDCPMSYIGITKQAWFERYSQHRSAAANGSGLIFHAALREHADVPMLHRVLVDGLDYKHAMNLEEEFVDLYSLYPQGLNMIPGGFAGIRYLSSLGITARSAAERDMEVERIANRESINGKPNPLCAARWASDQDFVNRVICGHSGRLNVDQVRQIRLLASFGKPFDAISELVGTTVHKVKAVADGKRYGRVE